MVTAGAGTQALAWLLGVAGASRTLLEALIPYDESSFDDFLGQKPRKYVTPQTAGLLAGRAVTRARQLYGNNEPVIGLACTATIVTDRPKRGEHRAHIAAWTSEGLSRCSLHLKKGARDRNGEEDMVSRTLINALAQAYHLDMRMSLTFVEGDDHVQRSSDVAGRVARLHQAKINFFGIRANGYLSGSKFKPAAVLSGAFNPLHDGHLSLSNVASRILGQPVTFELAAANADKPTLSQTETQRRLLQFAGRYPILASNAPTFVAKSQLFPGATFVVGYDTAERVLQTRFYEDSRSQMMVALAKIRERGCRFLVASRTDDEGRFNNAADLDIPEQFRDLFSTIPAEKFRLDVSSTRLRAEGKQGSR
jgi:hypothetical protein